MGAIVRFLFLTFLLEVFFQASGSNEAYSTIYSEEDCYHVKRINLGHSNLFHGGDCGQIRDLINMKEQTASNVLK